MQQSSTPGAEEVEAPAPAGESSRRRWAIAPADPLSVSALATQLGCPGAVASLLLSRGLDTPSRIAAFFTPSVDDLHDPSLLLGMGPAVARVQRAVTEGEMILIYGDYDVDGTTATVLLKTALERIAPQNKPARVRYHVPHRIREGYGMQAKVLGEAAIDGVSLVISVDTGIRAFAAAEEAKALGLDLIVTDHHLPDDYAGIPQALAVINPAQAGCRYPFKSLCGAAVAFKLAYALLSAAATNEAEQMRLKNVLVPSFLKLVAIATIADSVPLTGENRAIAWLGLRELRNPVSPGLRALMQVAQIPLDRSPTATEVGFRLAPRINAAGRMDVASDVVELLLTRDAGTARKLAEKLDRLNSDRRDTEAQALERIEEQLAVLRSSTGDFPPSCIILDDAEWHRGVIGILASRVVDRTGRPALVLTHEDGHAHGSGRSVEGFHLLDALTALNAPLPSVFTRFGGHAHAVGFSLPSGKLAELRERMERLAAPLLAHQPCQPLNIDAEVLLSAIDEDLYLWIQRCSPFGNGNPEPLFASRGVRLANDPRIIKNRHLCLNLDRGDSTSLSVLGWSRSVDWPERCRQLELKAGSCVDLAFHVRLNTHARFGGIELELCDLRPCGEAICQGSNESASAS